MLTKLVALVVLIRTTTPSRVRRVVGGEDTEIDGHGYVVSIRRNHTAICGGSILNNRFILTAGHCVYGKPQTELSIRYGTALCSGGENATNVVMVKNVFVHPYLRLHNPRNNDIALLELEAPIEFSPVVQAVLLPPAYNATPENATATLVGWGRTINDGSMVEHLQGIDIRVWPDEECQKVLNATNNENHICAGSPESGKVHCKGDSGSPLMVDGTQIGVVSWSLKPCGFPGRPGAFVKVSTYVLWIEYVIRNRL